MKNIIIYGNGDFASLMYHYFCTDSSCNVVAFCADKSYIKEQIFHSLPLVSLKKATKLYPANKYKMFVAVGYSDMNARVAMFERAKKYKYDFVNYISSNAMVDASLKIGTNNAIFANVTLEPFVSIKDNNIIWSSATICHNVQIQSHSFISAGSLIGGNTLVDDGVFLGFNSTIVHNITLKRQSVVAAKSLVLKSTKKHSKYLGIPAKKVSSHKDGIKIK